MYSTALYSQNRGLGGYDDWLASGLGVGGGISLPLSKTLG